MKEYPILFSTQMVKAILDGKKTQTRRVVKPQPEGVTLNPFVLPGLKTCPYGGFGDRLWVREAFSLPLQGDLKNPLFRNKVDSIEYKTGMNQERFPLGGNFIPQEQHFKWRPSIHMPRWASRITLEITDVRVQRVQEITVEDIRAEGIALDDKELDKFHEGMVEFGYRITFADLWNSINEKRGYGWDSNPWVWAITFKVIK